MSVKIKICGITNIKDAMFCAEAGVDAIGFVFYEKSPRFISFEKAEEIISKLPPFVAKVGVFVNPSYKYLSKGIDVGITVLQLHGEENPEDFYSVKIPIIKVFRISAPPEEKVLEKWKFASAFLFEKKSHTGYGGTGERLNLEWLKKITKRWRTIVAGGLTPQNVKEVIQTLRPYGVDVSSGVEKQPGKKDLKLVKEFIKNAREIQAT